VRIKTPHFDLDFQAKRTLGETGKKGHSVITCTTELEIRFTRDTMVKRSMP
jgi:hypothetical protein